MASTNPLTAIIERLIEKSRKQTKKVRHAKPVRVVVTRPKKSRRGLH